MAQNLLGPVCPVPLTVRGTAALALPDASSSTVRIDMPATERAAYNAAKGFMHASDVEGKTLNTAEQRLSGRRVVCARSYAKVTMLLQQLRAATAAAKAQGKVANAVVFTAMPTAGWSGTSRGCPTNFECFSSPAGRRWIAGTT